MPQQPRDPIQTNEGALWEAGQLLPVCTLALLCAAPLQPIGVHDHIHVISAIRSSYSYRPGDFEALIVGMAALGARPMAGGERRRLVEEEELRPRVGLQQLAVASTKRRAAGDPAPHLPGAHDAPGVVMQDASIAHERATLSYSNNLANRRHPILQWHRHLLGSIEEHETEHRCYDALHPF